MTQSKVKFKTYDKFTLGKYVTDSDVKSLKDVTEEQIMNALNKSKSFYVRDWFGSVDLVTFTITNIEKDNYGEYIYTVESSQRINEDYFPSIHQICEDYEDIAVPIFYSIVK